MALRRAGLGMAVFIVKRKRGLSNLAPSHFQIP